MKFYFGATWDWKASVDGTAPPTADKVKEEYSEPLSELPKGWWDPEIYWPDCVEWIGSDAASDRRED